MQILPKSPNTYSAPLWDQKNDSDSQGSLWATFNCDFSENEGKLRVGRRLVVNTNTTDQSNMTGYPVAFKSDGSNIWTIAGGYVFVQTANSPIPSNSFVQDTTPSSPGGLCNSSLSDVEVFNGVIILSYTSTQLYRLAGGGWTGIVGMGNDTNPTPLCVYGNRLYSVANGNNIVSCDSSFVPSTTIGLAYTAPIPSQLSNLVITFMKAASDRMWIGTVNTGGGRGYVFEWNGVDSQLGVAHVLQAGGALSCVIKDDVPYIMDSNGVMSSWNGGTFVTLAKLNRKKKRMLINALSGTNNRFIHPNGMAVVNGKINLLIDGRNNDNPGSIEETIPSGVWEYDENRGLTHKHSVGQSHSGDTIVDYGAVDIGSTNNTGVGAIVENNYTDNTLARNGTIMVGATYYTDSSTNSSAVLYDDSNDTLQKAGYFISTKIDARDENGNSSVQNMWQNLYVLYKKLLDAADQIVVKYRVSEIASSTGVITWTGTNTFTVSNLSVVVSNYWTGGTGNEVEILRGYGAGKCSHITNAVLSGGTWTVTVDQTYVGASSQTAFARFENWIEYDPIVPGFETYDQEGINLLSNWIQFKVWMLFTGKDEIEKFLIINEDYNPAN